MKELKQHPDRLVSPTYLIAGTKIYALAFSSVVDNILAIGILAEDWSCDDSDALVCLCDDSMPFYDKFGRRYAGFVTTTDDVVYWERPELV